MDNAKMVTGTCPIGYDPGDRSTWTKEIVWMDRKNAAPIKEISPKAWGALCDVAGGEDRIDTRVMEIESQHFTTINSTEWSDAFIIKHSYMLHASSNNHSPNVRFMTNPPVVLKELLNLNRDHPSDFSLIELATLNALGVDRYDFQPTAPREERWEITG